MILLKYVILEHHPQDSRIRIIENDICQTLDARMGLGGGNVPILIEIESNNNDNNIQEDRTSTDE